MLAVDRTAAFLHVHLLRRAAALALTLVLGTGIASAAFAASASLEQVRNGAADATTAPAPSWGTGNAGASNSHYLESHSIAYRAVMDGLPTDGTVVEMVLGYNTKRSGHYAIDYLTHYQRLLPHVLFGHTTPEVFDPLDGVAGVDTTVSTAFIPTLTQNVVIDPDGAESNPAVPQPATSQDSLPDGERLMTLFGGTLIDVTYLQEGDVSLATNTSETHVRVRFTASSPTAVLAWGGHIASRWDYGFEPGGEPRSAGGINGSSYHMQLIDWNLGNLGSQDRSMSTDAVFPVPRCGISNTGPHCAGSLNTHTAPAGMESYSWELFDNTAGAFIVGTNMGTTIQVQTTNAGSYGLMLTTTATGFVKQCDAVVVVNAPGIADAGADHVVCASDPLVQLAGFVSGGTGTWSGGAGTFSPGAGDLNAIYTPTAAEIAAGGVTLTLTNTPWDGVCPPVDDQVQITIDALPTADAGPDQVVCESAALVQLAGSVSGSVTGGTWSGGAGTFSPSASALDATYQPTPAEIAAGSVTLTLTSDDPADPCPAVADPMTVTIDPSATADAGPDQIVCASDPTVQLAGSFGGTATSAVWSGGGGKFTPNASVLDASYEPTAEEIAAGQVTLVLTADAGASPCPQVADAMTVTIDPITVVDAGPDLEVCSSAPIAQLAGSVSGAVSGGVWSGGAGTFDPGANALDATYTPSPGEIAAGSVTLTLTSAATSRPCPPASDVVTIAITPAATVDAGADQIVCAANPTIQLAGSVGSGATSGTWTGGSGTFDPNAATLNATYTPSAAEIADGGVTLTLVTNDPPGACPSVSDEMTLTISNPVVNVRNRIVCTGIPNTTLCADVSGGIGPYTYEWGDGSTSRCIAVSDTGSYSVTVTDAHGCRASDSGRFGHRDCEGLVSHTSVNCETFMDGTGDGLSSDEINVSVSDNIITGVAPGVFFYWTFIQAPRENFTVDLVQTKTNLDFPYIPVHNGQVTLFDAGCNSVGDGVETSTGQASVEITGAEVGQGFIISVKYNLKALIGTFMHPSYGCRYDFLTVIDGVVVDQDPDGLQFGSVGTVGVGDPPPGGDDLPILRPVPNPFRGKMQMSFTVPSPGTDVSIHVYDVSGRLVRTLVSGTHEAGTHVVEWDGRDGGGAALRKGAYFLRVRTDGLARHVRVVLLR